MNDPLILAARLADAAGIEHSSSRDVKCLQLARWMREEGALSGDYEMLFALAAALDKRFLDIEERRWAAALFLLAAGSTRRFKKLEIPCPKFLKGWTRAAVQRFVLTGIVAHGRRRARR